MIGRQKRADYIIPAIVVENGQTEIRLYNQSKGDYQSFKLPSSLALVLAQQILITEAARHSPLGSPLRARLERGASAWPENTQLDIMEHLACATVSLPCGLKVRAFAPRGALISERSIQLLVSGGEIATLTESEALILASIIAQWLAPIPSQFANSSESDLRTYILSPHEEDRHDH